MSASLSFGLRITGIYAIKQHFLVVIQGITEVCSVKMCQMICHSVYNRYVLYKCVKCYAIQCTTGMFCTNVKCFVIQCTTDMFCINVSSVLSFSVYQVCSV